MKRLSRYLKIDYRQFREILRVKLTADNRRAYLYLNKTGEEKENRNAFFKSLLVNAVIGMLIGMILIYIKSFFLAMILLYSIIMFMTAVAMISNFTNVLVDTTDNMIILPRPVHGRTLLAARITHICIYMLAVTLSLSLASMVIGTVKFGFLFFVGFLITLVLSTLLVVFLLNLFYVLLLKISGGEKFLDVINRIQVSLIILLILGVQIVPRLIEKYNLKNFVISSDWWIYLAVPAWMTGTLDAIVNNHYHWLNLKLMALSVIVPLLSLIIVILCLAPHFNRSLSRMDIHTYKTRKKTGNGFSPAITGFFAKIFTRTPAENISFQMAWVLLGRDRKFKIKTYPTFAVILFFSYIVIYVFTESRGFNEIMNSLSLTYKYLILLYTVSFLPVAALPLISSSDNYEAAWLYRAVPLGTPGDILAGALKTVIVKIIIPFFMLISAFILYVWGIDVIDDILLSFSNILLICLVLAFIYLRCFPFSQQPVVMDAPQRTAKALLSLFLLLAALGGAHYLLLQVHYGVLAAIPISFAMVFFLFRRYKNTPWPVLNSQT